MTPARSGLFRDGVADILATADVATHPSVVLEPLDTLVIMAMDMGPPTEASKRGGPAGLIAPGSGLPFDTTKPEESLIP